MSPAVAVRIACGAFIAAVLTVPGPAQSIRQDDSEDAVFRTVVGELARSPAEGVLLVDPRTILPGADLLGVEAADVGSASNRRERVLREMGIARTDLLADKLCLFTRGNPPPPEHDVLSDSAATVRRACGERPVFTSILVGAPRALGAERAGEVAVTVAGLTTSTYFVRDYVLRRSGPGWRIVGMKEVTRIAS